MRLPRPGRLLPARERGAAVLPRFDEAQRDRVEKAAAACPVQAILVDYSDEPVQQAKRVEPHVG
ncbi:ferredoxin [Streptomyces lasalocidi]